MKNRKLSRQVYNYAAIFDPAEEGGYNVSFPAFPGCVTFGRTFEEAKEKAKEVLELWLEELAHRNELTHSFSILAFNNIAYRVCGGILGVDREHSPLQL